MSYIRNKQIQNFHPHAVTGKTDDSFVGLRIIGNQIHFYYPETYRFDVNAESVRADIIDLLRTINIAKTSSSEPSQMNNKMVNKGEFALMSYLWVIKDYLANSFYVNREKRYEVNQSGRVNWKRTMQSQPIVSNGNIIYPNITVEVKSNVDNILVDIHKYCVKKSIDFIGWLFGLNSTFIESKLFNSAVKKLYISTLKKELERTFDDDKKLRLKHLLNVVVGLDSSDKSNEFVYGVDHYSYIFERMIDSIFSNVRDMKDFNPTAKWQLVRNNYRETKSSDLRPDTILLQGTTAFVLDSKFYRFGYTGVESDLPETTSIQKQITYGDFIKKNAGGKKYQITDVYNAFLLPYDKEREIFCSKDNIQYIGFAKSTWKDNSKPHEYVHTFLIDLKHVVKTWNRFNHDVDIQFLVEEIKKRQNETVDMQLRH
ncbi:MAG: LlaJI family restriction endonuclease [Clostridia bacterium]|nr:LlaJI family restriction endonuclease [Clostridia bacterium]